MHKRQEPSRRRMNEERRSGVPLLSFVVRRSSRSFVHRVRSFFVVLCRFVVRVVCVVCAVRRRRFVFVIVLVRRSLFVIRRSSFVVRRSSLFVHIVCRHPTHVVHVLSIPSPSPLQSESLN